MYPSVYPFQVALEEYRVHYREIIYNNNNTSIDMELNLEVKGYVQNALATKIYSWDKIKAFGTRVGVDTSLFDDRRGSYANFTKRRACEYIMENIPRENSGLAIKTFLDMGKRGQWDRDYS